MHALFRRSRSAVLLAGVALAFACASATDARAVDTVTVNPATVINDTSTPPIGINSNYLMDSDRRRPWRGEIHHDRD